MNRAIGWFLVVAGAALTVWSGLQIMRIMVDQL